MELSSKPELRLKGGLPTTPKGKSNSVTGYD